MTRILILLPALAAAFALALSAETAEAGTPGGTAAFATSSSRRSHQSTMGMTKKAFFSPSPAASSSSWCSSSLSPSDASRRTTATTRLHSEAAASSPADSSLTTTTDSEDDDDDEWEYVEFETLSESDFYGSEWKVGTVWDSSETTIKETWARLVTSEDGENLAIWGDGGKGKWNFDVASQFLSVSKESFGGWFGKRIWAGVVDDYYYMSGTVRGWSPISPASVLGQWQAKRLGVDPEEAGVAPWFQTEEEEEEEEGDSGEAKLEKSDGAAVEE